VERQVQLLKHKAQVDIPGSGVGAVAIDPGYPTLLCRFQPQFIRFLWEQRFQPIYRGPDGVCLFGGQGDARILADGFAGKNRGI
jgi:hypothetical protein